MAILRKLSQTNATITTFDPPGSTYTYPDSINDAGAITGEFVGTDYVHHGFVRIP